MDTLEILLSQINRHSRYLAGIHISGGEPFLRPDLFLSAVEAMAKRNLPIEYVETNAFWCRDDTEAEGALTRLREAGLPAILVSVSPFHSEFIPLERAERAIRVGKRVFGPENVHVYTDFFLHQLQAADPRYPIPFEDYIESAGLELTACQVADRYGLIPNGRAALELSPLFERKPASSFFGTTCMAELTSPLHAHIDLYGNVITGLCAGISVGDGRNLDALFAGMDPDPRPVLEALTEEGVEGLLEYAVREFGYREDPDGYIAKCHLCLDIRRHLIRSKKEFIELAPKEYYLHLLDNTQ
jgi:hypothetical protein